jgi:hypothetical protein
MRFLFLTLAFTAGEDDDLEHPSQEQEEWRRRQSSSSSLEALRTRDHVSTTCYGKIDRRSSATTDRDSIGNYPIIRISPQWDPNNESQRINMVGCSNREVINSSSKYIMINESTTIKCGSSSSSCTPPQSVLHHGPTVGPNLWDRSRLLLPNRYVLSDRQAMHHHLRQRQSLTNVVGGPNDQMILKRDRIWCTWAQWCSNAQNEVGLSIARWRDAGRFPNGPCHAGLCGLCLFMNPPPAILRLSSRDGRADFILCICAPRWPCTSVTILYLKMF